jgi:hypothetical protein
MNTFLYTGTSAAPDVTLPGEALAVIPGDIVKTVVSSEVTGNTIIAKYEVVSREFRIKGWDRSSLHAGCYIHLRLLESAEVSQADAVRLEDKL